MMLEKIFKNKKGLSGKLETHPLEKPLLHDKAYEYHHKKSVLEDGKLYDTETAKKVFTDEASLEYIALGRVTQRVYFLTPNRNWFSAEEKIETESGITDVISLYFDWFGSFMQAFIFCMLTMMFISTAAE